MTNMDDSPPLQPQQTERNDGLVITETVVTVIDDDYRILRVVAPQTGRGLGMIDDADGKPILVFADSFPAKHVAQLIIAWHAGRRHGLKQRDREVS